MNSGNSLKSRKLSLSGILLAFTIIILFLATVLPVNELSFYALSSFFVSIVVIEFGIGMGWIFYISSCLLSLIIPNKLALLPYIFFFGIYGIIKYYIEKIDNIFIEYVLKMLYFNINVIISVLLVKEIFADNFSKFPWWVAIIIIEIAFVVYDYSYSLFVQFYNEKLKKMLKI